MLVAEYGVAELRPGAVMAKIVPKIRGWAIFSPHCAFFLLSQADRGSLTNICTKGEGLKRPRCPNFRSNWTSGAKMSK